MQAEQRGNLNPYGKDSLCRNPKTEPNRFTEVGMVHIGIFGIKYSMRHHYTILLSYKSYKHI